jgi:superfamily I DNA/RNA helicase
LSKPRLSYDYILFDEGQDASGAMLDVFLRQPATKVIVGDTHQQIYGWRHAVNSLEKTDFNTFQLSASFRFRQPIADLAREFLGWKKHIDRYTPVTITGHGNATGEKTKATIARSNLGLLLNAITYITDHPKTKQLYFEGNIHSYTYAEEGASLYDVLHLYNNRHDRIRDKLIRSMQSLANLEEYIDKTEDAQLGMMVEIVKEYGNEIPGILQRLKDLHTGDGNREEAEMIFSTVHKAKGMEYDVVQLVDDFIKEADLAKPKTEESKEILDIARLVEEINLLYVAVTRAKNLLLIPESLVPEGFLSSPFLHILKKENGMETGDMPLPMKPVKRFPGVHGAPAIRQLKEKAGTLAQVKKSLHGANKPWTTELDRELRQYFESDASISAMAAHFGRTKGAIIARLRKLDLFDD